MKQRITSPHVMLESKIFALFQGGAWTRELQIWRWESGGLAEVDDKATNKGTLQVDFLWWRWNARFGWN